MINLAEAKELLLVVTKRVDDGTYKAKVYSLLGKIAEHFNNRDEALEYIDGSGMTTLVIATIASAISGYLTIGFLLKFLRSNSTFVFVFYRIIIGGAVIFMVWNNIINP